MRPTLRLFALSVLVAFAAFAGSARAQVIYSNTPNVGSTSTVFGTSSAIQLFTNTTDLSSVSWSLSGAGGSGNFSTYVAAWNTGTNTASGLISLGSSTPFTASGGAVDLLTFSGTVSGLTAGNTYALILSADSGLAFALAGNGIGTGPAGAGPNSGLFGDALGGTSSTLAGGVGWGVTFSGTSISAVPEPKTAAAGLAVLFIAALVGRRLWLQRKAIAAPLAA